MFKQREKINRLEAEVEKLKGLLSVKNTEIEFYKMRGDRYFTQMDQRQRHLEDLFQFAKEILSKLSNKVDKK